jgi:2-phospho-L-lactate guanylyltransferase
MIFALLPVKEFKNAKQRLASLLTPAERDGLALAMYRQMLSTLCAVRGVDKIAVATSDEIAAAYARDAGVEVFEETEQRGHSHSADAAARRAMDQGAKTVMLLPIDVPLVTRSEIEELIAVADTGLVVTPDAEGTGTNALVRTPPDAIQSCFGPGSFRKHLDQAKERAISVKVVSPPGLTFDIDTPTDISELLRRSPESSIARFLRAL